MSFRGISPLLETVATGLRRADQQALSAAVAIAAPDAPSDVVEFSSHAVELTQARLGTSALVKIARADQEMFERLLDTLA